MVGPKASRAHITAGPLNPRIHQDRANVGRTYQGPDATGIDPNRGRKPGGVFNKAAFALQWELSIVAAGPGDDEPSR